MFLYIGMFIPLVHHLIHVLLSRLREDTILLRILMLKFGKAEQQEEILIAHAPFIVKKKHSHLIQTSLILFFYLIRQIMNL